MCHFGPGWSTCCRTACWPSGARYKPFPSMRAAALASLMIASAALADAGADRFSAGGYFRVMTRPDFQGGNSKLGFSDLYGRLLNEGPYAALELNLDVLQPRPGSNDVWAAVHAKLEGGSVSNVDSAN